MWRGILLSAMPCFVLFSIAVGDGKPAKQKPVPPAKRSLGELGKLLEAAPRDHDDESEFDEESILVELIRRGGKDVEKLLKRRLKDQNARRRAEILRLKRIPANDDDARFRQQLKIDDASRNLHLLTALRRVQGKPDPLFVHVFRPAKLKATTRKLPMVDVALRLPGKTQVWIKQGGDGRSGRQARWRFEVRDAKGKLLPARKNFSFIGGGQYMEGFLKFGRQYRTTLNMSRFVRIPKAGEYTVRIHYHNAATIADLDDHTSLKDFIVFSSKSFRLKVTQHPKRLIQLKPGERKRATALIGKLNADAKLKIVFGRYDKSAHKFLSPKSPPGQLLTMGWQAAPVLLETLADKKTSLRKRAWILSLLSTISGEEDFDPTSDQFPFNSHILPAYETHFDPAFSNFSFGISGGGAELESFFGPIKKQLVDRKAQQKFIDRWLKFRREYLDIREAAVPRPAPPEER